MYIVSVKQNFVAEHFRVGGDWGQENHKHSHDYSLEAQFEGTSLDQHGYLVDIVNIKKYMEELLNGFRGKVLNDIADFGGLNPSLEHFTRIFCQALSSRIQSPNLTSITVKIWEDEFAWASYRQEL